MTEINLANINVDEVVADVRGMPMREQEVRIKPSILEKELPFTWGIDSFDQFMWLIDYNRFVLIAWEWGAWKTTYTMQQALANARNWFKVWYMSLEMWRENLIKNIARNKVWIWKQVKFWQAITLKFEQKIRFENEVAKLQDLDTLNIIWYTESLNMWNFSLELDNIAKTHDMIFIDNIWMIDRWKKELEIIPRITECIMKIRQKHKCTIVALHHMNKWSEKNSWPRGRNAIRWSGKVIDDADIIITITRDEENTIFSVVKDRDNWVIGKVRTLFNRGEFIDDIFK